MILFSSCSSFYWNDLRVSRLNVIVHRETQRQNTEASSSQVAIFQRQYLFMNLFVCLFGWFSFFFSIKQQKNYCKNPKAINKQKFFSIQNCWFILNKYIFIYISTGSNWNFSANKMFMWKVNTAFLLLRLKKIYFKLLFSVCFFFWLWFLFGLISKNYTHGKHTDTHSQQSECRMMMVWLCRKASIKLLNGMQINKCHFRFKIHVSLFPFIIWMIYCVSMIDSCWRKTVYI